MMIAKEAKIWFKCFLRFLHDLICDFFALYLSQYRLNKLFLHNLFLWFSFYVRISYSNSSSPLASLVYSTVLLPTFISFKAYTYNTIVFSLVILSSFYSFALLFHATFPSSLLPKFTITRRPSLSAISHILSRIYYAKNRITMPQ